MLDQTQRQHKAVNKRNLNSTTGTYTMFCFKLNKNCSLCAKLQHMEKDWDLFSASIEIRWVFGGMVVRHTRTHSRGSILRSFSSGSGYSISVTQYTFVFPCVS